MLVEGPLGIFFLPRAQTDSCSGHCPYTTWNQQHYTIGQQILVDAGTSCANSYTEINKTIILDLTNPVKLLSDNHNNAIINI